MRLTVPIAYEPLIRSVKGGKAAQKGVLEYLPTESFRAENAPSKTNSSSVGEQSKLDIYAKSHCAFCRKA